MVDNEYSMANYDFYQELAPVINALDFDTVFEFIGGEPVRVDTQWAPEVYHDPAGDVTIDSEEWECLTGLTGQYCYHGAVMHSSEFVGGFLAEVIVETATGAAEDGKRCVFAIVVVNVFPEDDPDYDPDNPEDSESPEPAGWAIAYKVFPWETPGP